MSDERRAVGRPSKYNEDVQAHAEQYIYDFKEQGDVIPSQAGLCCWLGIAKSTSQLWAKEYPEFSATLDAIQIKQEALALNGGLNGAFNATITKLVLANHGYSEKQEIDHRSGDGTMSPTIHISFPDDKADHE